MIACLSVALFELIPPVCPASLICRVLLPSGRGAVGLRFSESSSGPSSLSSFQGVRSRDVGLSRGVRESLRLCSLFFMVCLSDSVTSYFLSSSLLLLLLTQICFWTLPSCLLLFIYSFYYLSFIVFTFQLPAFSVIPSYRSCLFSRGLCPSLTLFTPPRSLCMSLFSKPEVWASPAVRPLHLFCPFEQLTLSCLLLKTRHLNWVKVNSGNQILLPRVCFYLCFVFIIVGCVCARDQPKVKGLRSSKAFPCWALWLSEFLNVWVSEYLKTHGCSFGFVEAISASGGWSNRINPYLLIKLIYSIF